MALNLKDVQMVDDQTKLLIYGFNRECQRNLFPQNIPYYNIPPIVNHICLLFYWQKDFFKYHGENIALSDDKMTAKVSTKRNGWVTVYGNNTFNNKLYPNMIIEYEMEINILPGDGAFGITSADKEKEHYTTLIWNQHVNEHRHEAVYTFHNQTMYYHGCGRKDVSERTCKHRNGDRVRMTIDISNKSLTFWSITQNKRLGKYVDIDYSITYRLAISMWGPQSVTILGLTIKKE